MLCHRLHRGNAAVGHEARHPGRRPARCPACRMPASSRQGRAGFCMAGLSGGARVGQGLRRSRRPRKPCRYAAWAACLRRHLRPLCAASAARHVLRCGAEGGASLGGVQHAARRRGIAQAARLPVPAQGRQGFARTAAVLCPAASPMPSPAGSAGPAGACAGSAGSAPASRPARRADPGRRWRAQAGCRTALPCRGRRRRIRRQAGFP